MIYLNVVLLISEILYKGQAYAVSTGLLSFLKVEMVFTFQEQKEGIFES